MRKLALIAASSLSIASTPLIAQDAPSGPDGAGTDLGDAGSGLPVGQLIGPPSAESPSNRDPVTSLSNAIARAYAENPALEAERSNTRATRYRIPRALGQFGPSIDYDVSYGFRKTRTNRIELPDTVETGWSRSVTATLTQPIFTFGRLSSNLRQARAEVDFQEGVLESTLQQTLFATLQAYSFVLRDREAVRLAEANRAILFDLYEGSRKRLAVREITSPDLEQVVTRFELAESELAIARGQLAASEAVFLSIVGAPAGDLQPLDQLIMPAGSLDVAVDLAVAKNPILAAAIARERISRAQAKIASADRLPRIDFQGQAARTPVTPFREDPTRLDLSAVFSVSGNLFDSGVLANRQRELESFNQADVHLIDQARRDLLSETTSAWVAWKNQESAILSQSNAVDAADVAYSGANLQQRAGFRTTLDVLILARDLNSARVRLNTLTYDTYLAKARVLLAIGMLDEELFDLSDEPEEAPPSTVVGPIAD